MKNKIIRRLLIMGVSILSSLIAEFALDSDIKLFEVIYVGIFGVILGLSLVIIVEGVLKLVKE